MNKIYSKVWNKSLGQLVVASELASRAGKSGSKAKGATRAAVVVAVLSTLLPFASVTLAGTSSTKSSATSSPAISKVHPKHLSATRADVVNGSQLDATGSSTATNAVSTPNDNVGSELVATPAAATTTHYYSVNSSAAGNYNNDGATGADSLAAGPGAQALAKNDTAIGVNATAGISGATHDDQSVAIGAYSTATGNQSTALGNNAMARGDSGVAIGGDDLDLVAGKTYTATINGANVTDTGANLFSALTGSRAIAVSVYHAATAGDGSVALGPQALAGGTNSSSDATGTYTPTGVFDVAIGAQASASGFSSIALGTGATASADTSFAIGPNAQAVAASTLAIGISARASSANALAIGTGGTSAATYTQSTGAGALALGGNATAGANASGADAIAIGGQSSSAGTSAIAVGRGATVSEDYGIALGDGSMAAHTGDVALGRNSATSAPSTGPYTVNGDNGNIAATSDTAGVVSVGTGGHERQIQNLAAGQVTATSTDAVNGSQLYAAGTSINNLGQSTAAGLGGGSSYDATTGAVTTALSVGGSTYNNVNSALTAVNATASKGWNLSANGGTAVNVAPGGAADVSPGASGNIAVIQNGTDLTIDTKPDLTATSVTTGGSKLDNGGLTVDDGTSSTAYGSTGMSVAGGPSVTTAGIDAGNQKITNVAPGTVATGSTDAVNGGQLNTTNEIVAAQGNSTANVLGGNAIYDPTTGQVTDSNIGGTGQNTVDGAIQAVGAGWTASADSGASQQIKPSGAVKFTSGGDGNLNVTQTSTTANQAEIQVQLAKNLNLGSVGSVTMGDTTVNNSGVAVNDGTSSATYGSTGMSVAGGPSVTTAGIDAGNQKITNVAPGTVAAGSTDAVNGSQLYATNQAVSNLGSQVGSGSAGMFQVSPDANGTVPQATGTQSAAGGNGAAASGNRSTALGDNAQSTADDSVALGNGSVADRANSVSVGSVGNERQITNMAAGQVGATSTDAVNGSQLYAGGSSIASGLGGGSSYDPTTGQVTTALNVGGNSYSTVNDALTAVNTTASKGWNLSANGGTAANVSPGGTVDVSPGASGNIAVTQNGSDLTIDTKPDMAATSVTTGGSTLDNSGLTVNDGTSSATYGSTGLTIANGPSVTTAGIDADKQKITNVADGTVAAGSSDAVNGDQLNTVDQKANTLGDSMASNLGGGSTYNETTGTVSAPSYTMSNADGSTTTVNNVGDALGSINSQGIKYFHTNSTAADSQALGADSVAIGPQAVASSANAVATGNKAHAAGDAAIAEGSNATANGDAAVAMGSNVTANGAAAAATGSNATANGAAAVAMGSNARANGDSAVAAGSNASATGNNSVALGASATDNGNANATVLGAGASIASNVGGSNVALGQGSAVASAAVATPSGTIDGTTYNYAGGTPAGIVSVGTAGSERQIANVAAGRVTAGSTDAVNGSQLHATDSAIDTLAQTTSEADKGNVKYDKNVDGTPNYNSVTLAGPASTDGGATGGTTIGNVHQGDLSSTSTDAVNGSQLYAAGSSTANVLGGHATYDPTTGQMTDSDIGGTGQNTVDGAIQAVGAGWSASADSGTSQQIKPSGAVKFTSGGDGNLSVTQTSMTANQGEIQVQLAKNLDLGSTGSVATGNTTVNNGGLTIANGPSVTTAGIDADKQKITNVADGTVAAGSSDAVNGDQLNTVDQKANTLGDSMASNLGGGSTYNETTGTVSAPSYTMSNADGSTTTVNNVGDALGSINSQGIKYFHANSTGADSRALGKDSVAIGPNAVANNAGDVALGSGSSTAAVTPVAGDMIGSTEYSYAGTTPDNAVSVGSVGHERQVQNVAAGQVTATSTDAVNGSQLYATDSAIDTLSQTTSIADKGNVKYDKNVDGTPNYSSVTLAGPASTDGGRTGGTTIGNVHQGDLSSTSTDAVNGSQLYATNQQVGQNTTDITNLQSTTTELGDSTASNLGGGSTYDPATGAVSAPSYTMSNADGSTTTVNNVGDALGSINSQGIKYFHASSTAPDSQALGTDSVAIGPNAVASFTGDVALGAGSVTAAAVGTASETLSGVTYAFAGGTPTSTVSVGSAGQERTVTNVAAGRVSGTSTDAVNGSQLYATNQAVSSLGNQVTNIGNGSGGMFQVSQDHNTPAPAATGNDSAAGGAGAVASGDASLAVGNGSTASGNQGTALGNGAMASGTGSTAVGQGAVASADGSVALGNGSSDGGRGAEQYTGKYSGAQNNTAGTVSVGNAATGETRTISNVADGKEATDAVNLRQLDGAVQAANTYTDTQISKVDSTVTGIRNGSAGMFQVSQDANGTVPQATGMKSVAGGNNAEASGSQSTAVGDDAHATASNSVALGQGSVADRANSVSVGSAGNERQVTNVAAGTAGTDAVNVSQLNAAQAGSVQYGRNADGSVDYGNVTLNSGGSPAAIHNVEAGTAATDAVNVGQLNDGLNKTMNWSKSYTDERFQTLNSNLNTIGNRANAGIAAAIAMASLPQAYQPDQSAASVALGNFHGETGIAVGVSKISESGRYVFKLNASDNTRGDAGVGVGAGVVW